LHCTSALLAPRLGREEFVSNSTLAHLAQQERTRREILHKSDLIPPLPDVVVRVMGLLNKADTDPSQLESHLRFDQVLVAKMLGMVNSPFYGLRNRIGTVRDAIMVLGFRGLRSLILATSTAKFLARDFRCYGFADRGLWLHSISVAAGARTLTRKLGGSLELAEHMFVAGLLHDIGKMLLAPYLAERRVAVGPGQSCTEVERNAVGLDHTEAGALVAAKWNIAPMVQEVVKQHHASTAALEHTRETALVQVANAVACARAFGFALDHVPEPHPVEPGLAVLGVDGAQWPDLHAEVVASMESALASMASFSS
jgi:putative nucleotidyltransferase with HDIG domain